MLAMAIDVDGKTGNGIQLLNTRTGAMKSLDAGAVLYTGLSGAPTATISPHAEPRRQRVRRHELRRDRLARLASTASKAVYEFTADRAFPADLRVAAYRPTQWSEDGTTMFFGIAGRDPKRFPPSVARLAAGKTLSE